MIACVDGLNGFPNAIETVFPKTQVQLCIVHMVRNSVAFVHWQRFVCENGKIVKWSVVFYIKFRSLKWKRLLLMLIVK